MNMFCRILVTCVLGALPVLTGRAGDPAKPPSFLKVGSRYCFLFADGRGRDRIYAEIAEFGPGTWMRLKYVRAEELGRQFVLSKGGPPPGINLGESWFNLPMLAAVIPAEKKGSDTLPADTQTFPQAGVSYFFSGQGALPYLAKVLESGEGGWVRVQELTPKWSKDPPRNYEWWINMAFVTQLTEAKPKDLPE